MGISGTGFKAGVDGFMDGVNIVHGFEDRQDYSGPLRQDTNIASLRG